MYCVNKIERDYYRALLSQINTVKVSKYSHAFVPNKNIVTNARIHINRKITLSFDLSNFFDSCSKDKAGNLFNSLILDECFLDVNAKKQSESNLSINMYAPRQGLPTSPPICNLIFSSSDLAIVKMLRKTDSTAVYSRYADDLTISFDDSKNIKIISEKIKEIVSRAGFKLNKKKTKIQNSEKKSRREICSIMIDTDIHVSRFHKRKLRAAKHRLKILKLQKAKDIKIKKQKRQVAGLQEFCLLKEPKIKTAQEQNRNEQFRDAQKIMKSFSFLKNKKLLKVNKSIAEKQLSEDIFITNDPVYFLGMSSYTTGWTSCMILSSTYTYKKGVTFFANLKGVSLAILLSKSSKKIAGVERKEMIARCLLYHLRNEKICYGKIYGHDFKKLEDALQKENILSTSFFKNELVTGNAFCNTLPYLDNCTVEKVSLTSNKKSTWRLRIK